MSPFWRRVRLVVMLLLLGGGCNPLMLPFLFTLDDSKIEAELHHLYDKDKKKEVKVVVMTYTGLETRHEFLNADKEITNVFARELDKLCKANGEKVTIVHPNKVEEFKNSNPDQTDDLVAVGKHFDADFVIYIEANDLTLYQPNAPQFYQGRANLCVKLRNVRKPDDLTLDRREFTFTYPPEGQGSSRFADSDTTPEAFRLEFFNALAGRLAWLFTSHPTKDGHRERF